MDGLFVLEFSSSSRCSPCEMLKSVSDSIITSILVTSHFSIIKH